MQGGTSYLLPIVFSFSIAMILLIYWIAGKISAKGSLENAGGKTAPYACGEDIPFEELKVDLERFFVFAVYFLIFDVLAFLLATSFPAVGLVPIAYCLIVFMAVVMLLFSRRT